MKAHRWLRWLCLVALLLLPALAIARPGGGGSFGGGSRPSSGGGSSRSSSPSSGGGSRSSGGGSTKSTPPPPPVYLHRAESGKARAELQKWAIGGPSLHGATPPRPTAWPEPNEISGTSIAVMLFVLASLVIGGIALVVWIIARLARAAQGTGWSTAKAATTHGGRNELEAIQKTDPDFSTALFEDFLYSLFAEAHVARGARTLERLAPYLRPAVRQALTARTRGPVGAVVVGALRFVDFRSGDPLRYVVVAEIEANYSEMAPDGTEHASWITERWHLSRARTARSRPPERVRVFDCPGCGASLDKMVGGACRYCNRTVDTGEFDWIVDAIEVVAVEQRGPMLTGTTEEQGTDLPTVLDPQLQPRLAALRTRDPAFDPTAFQARIGLVFSTMQHAWTSLEWDRARPFLSDNLFQSQRYWIEAYRRAGLRNVTERARILGIELARVTQDRWFDAITVRVRATGLDYTVRDYDRAVVGGNPRSERLYTEYWTLFRGSGSVGAAKTTPVCPSCGAALDVTMAATCKHCNAKVNSGQFDWVLGRIEQDEVYTG